MIFRLCVARVTRNYAVDEGVAVKVLFVVPFFKTFGKVPKFNILVHAFVKLIGVVVDEFDEDGRWCGIGSKGILLAGRIDEGNRLDDAGKDVADDRSGILLAPDGKVLSPLIQVDGCVAVVAARIEVEMFEDTRMSSTATKKSDSGRSAFVESAWATWMADSTVRMELSVVMRPKSETSRLIGIILSVL